MKNFTATAVVTRARSSTSAVVISSREITASFVFPASEPGSSLECRLDGASPTTCRPPASQLVLESGPQTFEVWVTDDAGNAGSAAVAHTWTIGAAKRDALDLHAYASEGRDAP
jgi:hypothetical protein